MPTAYLAGPMTGYYRWNFDAFAAASTALREAGWGVWSPAERDLEQGFDPDSDGSGFDLEAALRADVDALLGCDVVALLPGWQDSPGVAIEIVAAAGMGIPAIPFTDLLVPAA